MPVGLLFDGRWLPFGLFVACNLLSLVGGSMIFLEKFDVHEAIKWIPKVTTMMGVPTFYTRLLENDGLNYQITKNVRLFISGSAPLLAETHEEFEKRTNKKILERYGMTETTGIISINLPHAVKIGSVGKPYPNTKIKIAEDGEICVMAPQNIKNYFNNKDATDRLLESNNNGNSWLRTGDVGYIDDDGYLFITDRKKDILITAGGKNVAPQYIENLLKTIPYVSQSMVYGDAKPYLTALITLDDDEITKFARDRKILYQDLSDLSQKRVVVQLINNEIQFINEKLPSYETIKKFKILEEDFDQDKDELTPTFKVKRKVVIDNYKILLESMY